MHKELLEDACAYSSIVLMRIKVIVGTYSAFQAVIVVILHVCQMFLCMQLKLTVQKGKMNGKIRI